MVQTTTVVMYTAATALALGTGELPMLCSARPPTLMLILAFQFSMYVSPLHLTSPAPALRLLHPTQQRTDLRSSTDAVYFDYKRRTDPNFRKSIKREKKRLVKAQKAEAEAANAQQRLEIQQAVRQAQVDGFPTDVEEKEAYFMNEVARGEGLCTDRKLPRYVLWMCTSFQCRHRHHPAPKQG